MADAITKSLAPGQSAGTLGRILTAEAAAVGALHNGLMPTPAKSTTLSAPYDVRAYDRTTDALPGANWTFKMATTDTTVDNFLVIDLKGTTTGSTAPNVGLNVIESIIVRSCGTVQEIPYQEVMQFVLAANDPHERDQIITTCGGTPPPTATPQTIVVPLPMFWTTYGQGRIRRNHPGLPGHLLTSGVEVEVRMNPATALLGSSATWTGSPYNRVTLVHVIRTQDACATADARAKGEWHHYGFEYAAIPRTAIASAATASLDLDRFKGNSAGIALFPVFTSNVNVNNRYVCAEAISNLSVNIDSATYYRIDSSISSVSTTKVMSYLSNIHHLHAGYNVNDASFSHFAQLVPFGGSLMTGKDGRSSEGTGCTYEGSLNLRAVQALRVDLRNDASAEITLSVLNLMYARFSVESGLIRRDI